MNWSKFSRVQWRATKTVRGLRIDTIIRNWATLACSASRQGFRGTWLQLSNIYTEVTETMETGSSKSHMMGRETASISNERLRLAGGNFFLPQGQTVTRTDTQKSCAVFFLGDFQVYKVCKTPSSLVWAHRRSYFEHEVRLKTCLGFFQNQLSCHAVIMLSV